MKTKKPKRSDESFFKNLCGGFPSWPKGVQSVCLLTFDIDLDSIWIARGFDEPVTRSGGRFGANVGLPNVLELLNWFGIRTTFFTPGWVADTYPALVEKVAAAGHDFGLHNYLHEPPTQLSESEEVDVLNRGREAIERVVGKRPIGYRSPLWQYSPHTLHILRDMNVSYTSDLMDTLMPSFHIIDGETTDMVNLPVNWILDDGPFFSYHISSPRTLRSCSDVLEIWKEEFRSIHACGGLFTLTMHPQFIGRPSRILMLKELVEYIQGFDRVWLPSPLEVVQHWREYYRDKQ